MRLKLISILLFISSVLAAQELEDSLLLFTFQWLDTTECVCNGKYIEPSDSVYLVRLQSLPCIVEMPYNAIVKRYIDSYMKRAPLQVARLKKLSEYYFPIFEDALNRYQLPDELKYLPVIESGLYPMARSRMGAVGLWQFMPSTAKLLGLEVNSLIDERFDPTKSTDAACRFLKSLYDLYGDWALAIAAYNCGAGNVAKAIRRAGGNRDFWEIYPYLPKETRSYLPLFIAANYALNFSEEHNICPDNNVALPLTDTLLIDRRLHLMQVAAYTDMSISELRKLNPQYSWDILPGGKSYALCLPMQKTGQFLQYQDSIFAYKADSLLLRRREQIGMAKKVAADGYPVSGMYYYSVKRGDSLGVIAKKQRCSVKQIKKWNNLTSDVIREGQKLKLYR